MVENSVQRTENIETIEIKISGKERKNANGQPFIAWKAITKKGEYKRLKFNRKCANTVPQEEGRYTIVVPRNAVSKTEDDFGELFWVSKVLSYRETEMESNIDDGDLPF